MIDISIPQLCVAKAMIYLFWKMNFSKNSQSMVVRS